MAISGKLIIISASSGAGKTTLVNALILRLQADYSVERVVTYTSRLPRVGEVNGRDYHFVSTDEFRIKIEQGFFIEWSSAYGAYYGSPRHELAKLQQGTSLLMVLDISGAKEVMASFPAVSIWIAPPSMEILKERLYGRLSETDEECRFRLNLAHDECAQVNRELIFSHMIINDDQNQALDHLELIIRAEMIAMHHVALDPVDRAITS